VTVYLQGKKILTFLRQKRRAPAGQVWLLEKLIELIVVCLFNSSPFANCYDLCLVCQFLHKGSCSQALETLHYSILKLCSLTWYGAGHLKSTSGQPNNNFWRFPVGTAFLKRFCFVEVLGRHSSLVLRFLVFTRGKFCGDGKIWGYAHGSFPGLF